MKWRGFPRLLLIWVGFASWLGAAEPAFVPPAEIARRVAAGTAVLVDVREPSEWIASGVAGPAVLLPLSDLKGDRTQWKPFLEAHRGQEIILYCRSGNRSGQAASLLTPEGFNVANGGAFSTWAESGQPVRPPTTAEQSAPPLAK